MKLIPPPLGVHRAFERRSVSTQPAMRQVDVRGDAA